MSNNRRQFLKYTGLALTGMAGGGLKGLAASPDSASVIESGREAGASGQYSDPGTHRQLFNMTGYAAPKIETVRIGFIGLGNRGSEAVPRLNHIQGVDIRALCDIKPLQVQLAIDSIKDSPHHPVGYSGTADAWKKMCERDDIDLIYIATPWALHTPMALYAMNHGKHVAVEVPAAQTIEQCWQLVETSERTKKHCVMLENECFDFFELLTLNMARQGFFGEIIHGEGAYVHNISRSLFDPERRPGLWRLDENAHRNGNLYPTHGLGPVCQVMNINRGDQLDYMVSVSSGDFTLNAIAKELAAKDPAAYQKYVGRPFSGNMNTSTIRTKKGKTIMLQHDISSSRPKSSRYLISGTKAIAQFDTYPPKVSITGEAWASPEELKALEEKYTLPFVARIKAMAQEIGGHGGMDVMMDWRLIDCLRNGLPMDYNVYDAALWSSVVPLSEASVKNGSAAVKFPDFTCGSWEKNGQLSLSIDHDGLPAIK
ncbi:Gfo/Idh/MocA family protein [Flavitalea flava]